MKWMCDTCGLEVKDGEPRYGLANKPALGITRHWRCHTPIEASFSELRRQIDLSMATLRDALTTKDQGHD